MRGSWRHVRTTLPLSKDGWRAGSRPLARPGLGPAHQMKPKSAPSLLYAAPLAIAAAYLVVLVVLLPRIVGFYAWDSDVASGFTLPSTLAQSGTGGHTLMTSTGAYVSLWFGLLTAHLPLHRALWELAPVAGFAAAALAIGWSLLRVATRAAAALGFAAALVVTPGALFIFASAYSHNIAYLDTALLGAYVVWLMGERPRRRLVTFATPPLAGAVLGVGLASDLLLLVSGVVPFAFTAVLGGVQRDRRSRTFAVSALATVAVAIPVALLTSAAMGSFGLVVIRPSTGTTGLSALGLHSELLFEGLKMLFGGYLGGSEAPGAARAVLGAASDVVAVAALLVALVLGAYTVSKLIGSLRRRPRETAAVDLATRLHVVYWTGSAVSTVVAFEFSVEADGARPEYYASLILTVAAIAPLLMRRTSLGGWLVAAGVSILFAASLVGLLGRDYGPGPLAKDERAIVRLADENRATTGYAGYWYASNLTWNSHERVKVRPVSVCENPTGADICPFYIARVPSWYAVAQTRSFLLVNPAEPYLPVVPEGLGRPLAVYKLGGSTTMYVYSYDIASQLGPNPD
jgi:hypothetical protein